MKKREIPIKNYISVLLITIVTVVLTFIILNYYKASQEYKNENNIMSFLSEVKIEELDNFITENHDIMIYLIDSNHSSQDLQGEVKKVITKNDFTQDIVVLNIKDNSEQIFMILKKDYFASNLKDIQLMEDSLLLVKEGKVVKVLNVDDENIKNLKNYIQDNFYGAS